MNNQPQMHRCNTNLPRVSSIRVLFSHGFRSVFEVKKSSSLEKQKFSPARNFFSTFRLRHQRDNIFTFFPPPSSLERVARRTKFDSDALIALNNIRSVRSLFLGARNLVLRPRRPRFWKIATAFFEASSRRESCSPKETPKRIHFYARRVRAHRRR